MGPQRNLARLAGDDPEAINCRSPSVGNGMAQMGWASMDLQEIYRIDELLRCMSPLLMTKADLK